MLRCGIGETDQMFGRRVVGDQRARNIKRFVCTGLLLVASPSIFGRLEAKDITAEVIRETDLDERIAEVCRRHCQGNRRKGELRQIRVARAGQYTFSVWANASLRYQHYQDPPKIMGRRIGGGFQVYSYTIEIEAYGTLDSRTCDLRIDRLELANDRLGLKQLAKSQVGKVYKIHKCNSFLADL